MAVSTFPKFTNLNRMSFLSGLTKYTNKRPYERLPRPLDLKNKCQMRLFYVFRKFRDKKLCLWRFEKVIAIAACV
jgi:hypothetical protein